MNLAHRCVQKTTIEEKIADTGKPKKLGTVGRRLLRTY